MLLRTCGARNILWLKLVKEAFCIKRYLATAIRHAWERIQAEASWFRYMYM